MRNTKNHNIRDNKKNKENPEKNKPAMSRRRVRYRQQTDFFPKGENFKLRVQAAPEITLEDENWKGICVFTRKVP